MLNRKKKCGIILLINLLKGNLYKYEPVRIIQSAPYGGQYEPCYRNFTVYSAVSYSPDSHKMYALSAARSPEGKNLRLYH